VAEETKGQVSTEMLLIVALLFAFFVPLLAYVFGVLSSETWKLDVQQAAGVARNIADTASRIAVSGEGTTDTQAINIPSRVSQVCTTNNSITLITYVDPLGRIDEVGVSDIPLVLDGADTNGCWNNSEGIYRLKMEYTEGVVRISRA